MGAPSDSLAPEHRNPHRKERKMATQVDLQKKVTSVNLPPRGFWWTPFDDKAAELKGAPGARVSTFPENVPGGLRVRYQNGAIYQHPDGRCAWVYGAINDRYNGLGGPASWLGLP